MTAKEFENTKLNIEILNLHSNNHYRRKYIRSFLTKELLYEWLYICGYSANYIAKHILKSKGYSVDAGTIISLCKELGINTRNCCESNKQKHSQTLRIKTNIAKYGKPNVLCKGTTKYYKKNRTIKKRYGVKNVFQLDSIKEKSKKTLIKKYGVTHPAYLSWRENNSGKKSKLHIKIEQLLTATNISYESEVKNKFLKYNTYLKRDYSPIVDILIESKKLVIEINGDIWHANPKIYKSTDMINTWNGFKSAEEIWKFDKCRKKQIESFGYKVIILWQLDIKNNINKVKNIIYEYCKN